MSLARSLPAIAVAAALALTVAGCVGPPVGTEQPPAAVSEAPSGPTATAPAAGPTDEPADREVADSCEWDSDAPASDAQAPTGEDGDLASVLIGSWQHTHFDSGEGWEATDNDIRYVFVSTDRMLYCQHVPGVTEHAENRVDISLMGSVIQPPSPHPGFEVLAYSTDRMVWLNNFDGSTYLLVRR